MLIIIAVIVIYSKRKTITVYIDGSQTKFITYKDTVKEALEDKSISIGPKDKIDPALDSKLSDNDTINIKKAVSVKINVDGKTIDVQSAEENVGKMLNAEGIELNDIDKVKPDKETKLTSGMQVDIIRVQVKTVTETVPVAFQEVVKTDSGLANTKTKVIQEGKNGEKQVITRIVYENGKETSKEIISEKVTKEPQDRIILRGTYPLMPVSRDGSILSYSKVLKVSATAYWAVNGIGKTYTASGRKAVRNPDGYSTIAVDPNIIPYGTKLFVEGYGFAIAADTGTGIIGDKIDVYFDTYKEACKWGLKYVNLYILK